MVRRSCCVGRAVPMRALLRAAAVSSRPSNHTHDTPRNQHRQLHPQRRPLPRVGVRWRCAAAAPDAGFADDPRSPGTSGRERDDEQRGNVVLLTVEGMSCGGCSAAVKRTLLNQPRVRAASVNLLTGTAAVTADPASVDSVGAAAARALTEKGFNARVRSSSAADAASDDAASLEAQRRAEDRRDARDLALSAALLVLCCGHHAGHLFHAAGLHTIAGALGGHGMASSPMGGVPLQALAAAAALAGPGRAIVADGFRSLAKGAPNMNTLVGVGSAVAALAGLASLVSDPSTPSGWEETSHLLEEPVMLLSVVLLGRLLERRAKRKAAAALTELSKAVPSTATLLLVPTKQPPPSPPSSPSSQHVEGEGGEGQRVGERGSPHASHVWWGGDAEAVAVSTHAIEAGDVVRVMAGEACPVDGVLLSISNGEGMREREGEREGEGGGGLSWDMAAITGESRRVTLHAGAAVRAGAVARGRGGAAVLATVPGASSQAARLRQSVVDAQARAAPSQRLADAVCGPFVFTVLGLSLATFCFWLWAGCDLFHAQLVQAHLLCKYPTQPTRTHTHPHNR